MRYGYNTNGFAHHRLDDALTILSELGYESVARQPRGHVPTGNSADRPSQRLIPVLIGREPRERPSLRVPVRRGLLRRVGRPGRGLG